MADQPSPPPPPRRDAVPAKPVVPPVAKATVPVPPVLPKAAVAVPPVAPKAPAPARPAVAVPPAVAARAEPAKPRAVPDAGGESAEAVPADAASVAVKSRPAPARDPGASTAAHGIPASVRQAPPVAPPPAAAKPAAPPAEPAAAPVPGAPVPAVAVIPRRTLQIAARPAGPDPLIGRIVARCKIEQRIGEGKTSVVYRATHTALGMQVAVKVLHPEVLEFPEIVQKFENEARAIARLDHPNVLKIYDVATEGDVHGIVMELLVGESVLDMVDREERLPAVDALRILRQAAAGLEAAHSKQIIHRDVKPQNLVVLPDGSVKLVDFGLATAPDSDMAASRIGTPHYMAPEVCEAKPAEPESDVYSLGITLYHLLVGAPPYAGKTVKEILAAHVEGKPLHPEWRAPGVPRPLCELVRDMTKRDPLTRMSMHDVIEVVDKIGGKELAASPRLSSRRSHVRAKAGAPVAAIMGGAVLVVGLLAFLFSQGGGGGGGPAGSPSVGRGSGESPGTPPDVATPPPPANPQPASGTGLPGAVPTPPPPAEPPPPPETDDERRAREEKERVARKAQSETALKEVEDFARLHEVDKVGVVREYRQVASRFKGTEAAKEAKRRAELIDKGEMHPNPDKTFTPPDRVAEAAAKWEAVRAQVDKALSAGDYGVAESLIPEAVDDPAGKLSEELVFWRTLAKDSRGFLSGLKRWAPDLKGKNREIKTPKGVGVVSSANEGGLKVDVGSETLDFRWDEFAPKDLLALATRAFQGKGDAYGSMLVSFAFVHRLRDEFWQYAVGRQLGGDAAVHVSRALARAEGRFPN